MKTVTAIALAGVLAFAVHAVGVSGKWTAQVPKLGWEPKPALIENTFDLKVEGKKLTGSADLGTWSALEIKDGEVDGNQVSFSITITMGEGSDAGHAYSFDLHFKGKVTGDTIEFARSMDAEDFGTPLTKFTAKRVK